MMGMEELLVLLVGVLVLALLWLIRDQQEKIAGMAQDLKTSVPPEVLAVLGPMLRAGVDEGFARAQAVVLDTPNTLDDDALEQIRALLVQLGALKDETAPSPD
jgi:hypothetical protein